MTKSKLIKLADLPFPRLELRWRRPNKQEKIEGVNPHVWCCDYVLVLKPYENRDVRCDDGKQVEYVLNTTKRDAGTLGHPMDRPKAWDTPYRDGKHAEWDSKLLNIPAFGVSYGWAYKLEEQ